MKLKRLWAQCIYDYVGQLCCYTCFSKHPVQTLLQRPMVLDQTEKEESNSIVVNWQTDTHFGDTEKVSHVRSMMGEHHQLRERKRYFWIG